MRVRNFLEWPFFEPAHRRAVRSVWTRGPKAALRASRARRRTGTRLTRRAARWCASWVGRLDAILGAATPRRVAVPELQRRAQFDVRALGADPRNSRLARRPRGLRLRDAGPRQRRNLTRRLAGDQGAISAARRGRRGNRRLRAFGVRRGLGCRRHSMQRPARRRLVRAGRREDLDIQRRHRRLLLRLCADQPGGMSPRRLGGRSRHQRVRRRCRHAGLLDHEPHRCHRTPSAGHPLLFGLPHSG